MTEYVDNDYDDNYSNDDDDYEGQPHQRMVASAITPKIAAILSLFGSTLIISELLIGRHNKHNNTGSTRKQFVDGPASRTLLAMSCADIVFSIGWFLSTWAAPAHLDYIWGNVGNVATCNFQGFLIQFGLMSSPLFNIALPFFYLLRIRYRWTDTQLQNIEPWLHGIVWSLALGTAIYPIPIGYYNNAWEVCWIESYPQGCGDDGDPCLRGANAGVHALVWMVFPVWISIVLAFLIMGMLYATVYQMESKISKYSGSIVRVSTVAGGVRRSAGVSTSRSRASTSGENGVIADTDTNAAAAAQSLASSSTPPQTTTSTTGCSSTTTKGTPAGSMSMVEHIANREKSKRVARQAIFYVLAFLTCYLLDAISTWMYYLNDNLWYFWLDIFAYFFLPLQGFLNCMVFMYNRKMVTSIGKWTQYVLFLKCISQNNFCCCCCRRGGGTKERDPQQSEETTKWHGKATAITTTAKTPPPTTAEYFDDTHQECTTTGEHPDDTAHHHQSVGGGGGGGGVDDHLRFI